MKVNYYMDCCGVKELSGLSSYPEPELAMRALGTQLYPDPDKNQALIAAVRARAKKDGKSSYAFGYMGVQPMPVEAHAVYDSIDQYSRFRFAIFTEAHNPTQTEDLGPKYGQRFAAMIRKKGLGDLIETGRHINPNSGNKLKVWVWTIDHAALVGWLKEDAKKRHAKQPTISLFAGGADRWAAPASPESPEGELRWAGNPGSNVIETVPAVGGLGGSLPPNCESTLTCAPALPRQG